MTAIFKKDFKSFFSSMSSWIVTAFTLAVIGMYFSGISLMSGVADFSYVLNNSTFIFLVIVPILTMRSLVEERRQKTDQLLLTAPISSFGIVMGKYLSLVGVYALPLLVSAVMPLILSFYAKIPLLKSYVALCIFFLMGAAALSIGLFISSLTDSLPLAAAGTFGVLLISYLINSLNSFVSSSASASLTAMCIVILLFALLLKVMTKSTVVGAIFGAIGIGGLFAAYFIKPALLEGLFGKLLTSLGLFEPFYNMVTGKLDISCIVYYISIALLFVFLSVQSIEKRRAG